MAIYSNLVVDQGSTFFALVDLTDANGAPLNLTNFTVEGQIRKSYASSTAVDFDCSVTNAEEGTIQIQLTDTVTNMMKAGRYVYDIEIISTSNGLTRTRVLEGQVEVTPGVTR